MQQDFLARATEVGARVHLATDAGDVAAIVVRIAQEAGARLAVVAEDIATLRGTIAHALQANHVALVEDPTPHEIARADLGVTGAALAIAETGSIVLASNALATRLAGMLPPVHVALVALGNLVPSLEQAAEFLRTSATDPGHPVRYVSFVGGPSRTADVEKTLSIGVHGPRELHIILFGESR